MKENIGPASGGAGDSGTPLHSGAPVVVPELVAAPVDEPAELVAGKPLVDPLELAPPVELPAVVAAWSPLELPELPPEVTV